MIIKTIGCSGTFEVGRPAFKKYWMEAELEKGETDDMAMDVLNAKIEGFNTKYNPAPAKPPLIPKTGKSGEKEKELQATLEAINNCPTLIELETYWMKAKGNLVLSVAYQTKQNNFINAK